ncbi:MAG TPA: RidA family protein [Bryobacteraceae bacterium]|nr:RidA family protein [Bryobacteraceae bacterium]
MKQIISTDRAPKAIGPYSQAVISNGFVFLSGQIALDPATNQMIDGDIAAETERVLENLKGALEASGASLAQVVKTTVFLKDMGEFAKMNEVYARYFKENPPARSTVEAARLPRDVRVEIDCVAAL